MIYQAFIYALLIFAGCHSKNSNNFSILKDAFINWYNKNHITEKFDYDMSYFNVKNSLLNDDYIEDINRFELELSQINKNDLRHQNKIDYEILIRIINQLYLSNINSKSLNFSINDVIIDIYNSLFYVMNSKNKDDFGKIITLNAHLNDVIKYLDNSKDKITSDYDKIISNEFNANYNILIKYIDFIKLDLLISDDTYKDLNDLIDLLLMKMYKYNNWVNYDYNYSSNIEYVDVNIDAYSIYIRELFNNDNYNYDTSIAYLKNKKKILKNDIFNESLKIYLNFNDEPIWVDSSDTLHVLNWVIKNKIKDNLLDKDNFLDNISDNYRKILNYYGRINSKELDTTVAFIRLRKEYEIVPDYYYNNGNFIINENSYEDIFNNYYSINLIFEVFFSMHNIYGSLNNNFNELRNIKNDLYARGISWFLYDLYVNSIVDDASLNKINFYLELLKKIEVAILQDTYIDNSDEGAIIHALQSNAFLSKEESQDVFILAFESNNLYIEPLLTYFHLLHLYENECLLSNKYSKGQFLDKIFNYGYVNYYTIN